MTAISAPSANETPSPTDPLAKRTVVLPGSERTYANRDYLRGIGLRWDPEHHRWHGTTTTEQVRVLRGQLGLRVRCFGSLDPPAGPQPPTPLRPPRPRARRSREAPSEVLPHDFSRTRAEARVVYRETDDGSDEIATTTRTFSLLDITSGLPDDSKEAEEREQERKLCDLRGRVQAARNVIARTPGLFEVLAGAQRRRGCSARGTGLRSGGYFAGWRVARSRLKV